MPAFYGAGVESSGEDGGERWRKVVEKGGKWSKVGDYCD